MRLVLIPGRGAFELLLEGFANGDHYVGVVDEHEPSIRTGDDWIRAQRVVAR